MRVLSLFTGAGGLDLGLEEAGFEPAGCVEVDADARATLQTNRPSWKLLDAPEDSPGDILGLDAHEMLERLGLKAQDVELLSGGPPCQPFSKAGLWVNGSTPGMSDPRANTVQAFVRVVEAALPEVVLLENVHGIRAQNGVDSTGALDVVRNGLEEINAMHGTAYRPKLLDIDADAYGVPQRRRRLFVIASRDGDELDVPNETHSDDAELGRNPLARAWDAIGELDDEALTDPELQPTGKWAGVLPSIPEGQNYLWHTPRGDGQPLFGWRTRYWSFLLKLAKNRPSWTLQAEPGPATGPFHWRNRLLSREEMARLQTFPSGYRFNGDYRSVRRQIGNAVPPALGELLGLEIRRQLYGARVRRQLRLIPEQRLDCPRPERRRPVPGHYDALRKKHPSHPGPGLGPGAMRREEHVDE